MSTTAAGAESPGLSEKQRRILAFLSERVDEQTYFKSRLIAEGEFEVDVEKWGYSSSTTWMVTDA